jgi:lipoate-protein ligase A
MKKIKYLFSPYGQPLINFKIEQWLLEHYIQDQEYKVLFFYINDPCVVMGRFQNQLVECQLEQLNKNNLRIYRRISGGGCVFHDLGNLNWCFISPKREIEKEEHFKMWARVFKDLKVNTELSERGDICIIDKAKYKISGSAYKQKLRSSLHHGSMLVESNLGLLNKLLKEKDFQIKSKGLHSNRSLVTNLSTFTKISINELISTFLQVNKIDCKLKINYTDILKEIESDYINDHLRNCPNFEIKVDSHTVTVKKMRLEIAGAVYDLLNRCDLQCLEGMIDRLIYQELMAQIDIGKGFNGQHS